MLLVSLYAYKCGQNRLPAGTETGATWALYRKTKRFDNKKKQLFLAVNNK
jgi:hypothetical protein